MDILISQTSKYPIYQQIYQQMKALILSGQLSEHASLPSMRLLAKELRISLITTKRAYDDLERDGFIVSIPGKGSFVAPINREFIREQHLKEMENHLKDALLAGQLAGLSIAEIIQALRLLEEE